MSLHSKFNNRLNNSLCAAALACVTLFTASIHAPRAEATGLQCGWVYDNTTCQWIYLCWQSGIRSPDGHPQQTRWGSCGDGDW